jgi:polyisoprenoid-binding protein YceI
MLAAAALSLLPTGPFALDRAASHLEFFVKDNRGGFAGMAPDLQAQAVVREQDGMFAADLIVRVDARSITTGSGLRDSQMRREFLQTDRYPEITFRGSVTPVDPVTGLSFRANVSGQLTIKDVTREMAFPVRVTALLDSYLIEGTTTIRMTDFSIPIPRFLIFAAEDPVQIKLRVRFVSTEK